MLITSFHQSSFNVLECCISHYCCVSVKLKRREFRLICFTHMSKSLTFKYYLCSLIIWTYKSFHMASRESLWAPAWRGQRRGLYSAQGVQRVCCDPWLWYHPDVQEDTGSGWPCPQLKGLGLLQKSIQPLKCWSAVWVSRGGELAVQRGGNQLLIFPFDTHGLTPTGTVRLTDFKDGQSTKDKPGGWKVWMKRNEGICLDILRNFLLQMQKQFYNIFFHIKKMPAPCNPGLWPRFTLEMEIEGSGNVATLLKQSQSEHEKSELDRISDGNRVHRTMTHPHLFWPYKPDFGLTRDHFFLTRLPLKHLIGLCHTPNPC